MRLFLGRATETSNTSDESCDAVEGGDGRSAALPRPPSTQRQRIILVRHGQGEHNVADHYWKTPDPKLTKRGEAQASRLRGHKLFSGADLVVCSPLSRAIQTALAAFEAQPATRFALSALLTERWSAPCDSGRPKSAIGTDFPMICGWEGFEELPEHWTPPSGSDRAGWRQRVAAFAVWLHARPERHIVCVGHSNFFAGVCGEHFANCEVLELPGHSRFLAQRSRHELPVD